jgi:hypothetical protein
MNGVNCREFLVFLFTELLLTHFLVVEPQYWTLVMLMPATGLNSELVSQYLNVINCFSEIQLNDNLPSYIMLSSRVLAVIIQQNSVCISYLQQARQVGIRITFHVAMQR